MTFESVEDDNETETATEATRPPVRLMRGPLTRRRERRILIALTYFGPLDEYDLYGLLRARHHSLTKALLNLAAEGLIACENGRPISSSVYLYGRVWSMRVRLDGTR